MARAALGFSLKQVSELCQLDPEIVEAIETGSINPQDLSVRNFTSFCFVLGLIPGEMLECTTMPNLWPPTKNAIRDHYSKYTFTDAQLAAACDVFFRLVITATQLIWSSTPAVRITLPFNDPCEFDPEARWPGNATDPNKRADGSFDPIHPFLRKVCFASPEMRAKAREACERLLLLSNADRYRWTLSLASKPFETLDRMGLLPNVHELRKMIQAGEDGTQCLDLISPPGLHASIQEYVASSDGDYADEHKRWHDMDGKAIELQTVWGNDPSLIK